jgi:hypothetical protein
MVRAMAYLVSLLVSAALTGLLSGSHCVVMCGGIAGALGLASREAAARRGLGLVWPLAYNLGRVLSYTAAGAIAGGVGSGVVRLAPLAALRTVAGVAAALALLLVGLRLLFGNAWFHWLDRAGLALWARLAPLARRFLPIDSLPRALGVGLLWGWMPCAMAYAMLVAAALSADVVYGAGMMLAFGLGTLPWLLLTGALLPRLSAAATHPGWRVGGGLAICALATLALLGNLLGPRWPLLSYMSAFCQPLRR